MPCLVLIWDVRRAGGGEGKEGDGRVGGAAEARAAERARGEARARGRVRRGARTDARAPFLSSSSSSFFTFFPCTTLPRLFLPVLPALALSLCRSFASSHTVLRFLLVSGLEMTVCLVVCVAVCRLGLGMAGMGRQRAAPAGTTPAIDMRYPILT
eukprot:130662-Rhodomonas_salina.3